MTLRGSQLLAEVQGSRYEPYRVEVTLGTGAILNAHCSCPYDWGGYCKHIVATLLTCLHERDSIDERPTIEAVLAEMDRDQLKALVSVLAERQPDLVDWIESLAMDLKTPPQETGPGLPPSRQRVATVNATSIRRQVRATLRGLDHMRPSEAYWHTGAVADGVREVLKEAWASLQADDGDGALVVLEALTEEYMSGWEYLDDSDGELGAFFSELGPAWAEALLTAELTSEQRRSWARRLGAWQTEVGEYGVEGAFDAAQSAATQGWDAPAVKQVLQGDTSGLEAQEGYGDDLHRARLNVLERRGRTQEYLYLAQATGQTERYATMLVNLGRTTEAVAYGLSHLPYPEDALALAQALSRGKDVDAALQVGEHGLTLPGEKTMLARWLREEAAAAARPDLALRAAIVAFHESLGLEDYQAVHPLAGAHWTQVRAKLLEHLAAVPYAPARIEIYLHEGMVDEAVKAVDEGAYVGYAELERVVDAAAESHPDWAIGQCLRQADSIMDHGKSNYYDHAVRWLSRARALFLTTGRESEWRAHLQDLLARHRRKYSLVPSLKDLR